MPMIINSNGKIIKPDELIVKATMRRLVLLYEELKEIELKRASRAELDRLTEIYGLTRQNDLFISAQEKMVHTKAHGRFRITSGGKAHIQHRIGFTMTEELGVGIINPRAITKLTKVSNE